MKADAAFVLALARGDARSVELAENRGISADGVLELAEAHQVAGLCWWMAQTALPPEAARALEERHPSLLKRLRDGYLRTLVKNDALFAQLTRLDDELAAKGVPALLFKGPWLALQAYPDAGTRPIGDLDIGIRECDVHAAVAALLDAGYRPAGRLPTDASFALRRAHYASQARFGIATGRPVELHFRLVNVGPPVFDEQWVWSTARDLQVEGRALRVPGAEAMLLHLLIHANQHGFATLRLLHDIRWAIARDAASIDWRLLLRQVGTLRCGPLAYYGLRLSVEMAGADVSTDLLRVLRPSTMRRAVYAATWRVGRIRRLEARRRSMRAEAPRLYLLEMGRLRDKVAYLANVMGSITSTTPPAREC